MEKKKYWPLTLAAFGGGCLLMAAVYFCLGWWPFGTGTVLTGDLRGLYKYTLSSAFTLPANSVVTLPTILLV